jgi:ribosomal protein S18 acetylase RimI-like enzyme
VSHVIPIPRLEIRPARTEDLDAVTRMVAEVWSEIYEPYLTVGSTDRDRHTHIAELIGDPGRNGWVAVLGRHTVGYCSIVSNCIEQVWVGTAVRRRGIGTKLTRCAIDAIRSRGFSFAQMGCEDFNGAARGFLEASNWKHIGSETRSMADGRKYDARVYSRPLI